MFQLCCKDWAHFLSSYSPSRFVIESTFDGKWRWGCEGAHRESQIGAIFKELTDDVERNEKENENYNKINAEITKECQTWRMNWEKKKLFFLWFMTFSKVTTDKEGLGECVWWGKETEILAGRVESMGLVAEVVVARMKISWILSKGGRQMIYLSFHFQYCLSPSSGFQAKLGEMGSGIMPSRGNHLANASHALALRFILMETICH